MVNNHITKKKKYQLQNKKQKTRKGFVILSELNPYKRRGRETKKKENVNEPRRGRIRTESVVLGCRHVEDGNDLCAERYRSESPLDDRLLLHEKIHGKSGSHSK